MSRRTALYRLFDDSDALLYIGIAYDPTERWKQHTGTSPWWERVARKAVEWHPSRAVAEQAETAAIKSERPRYNGTGSATPMNVHKDFPIATEVSTAQFRTRMADVINEAVIRGEITYITSRGRRIAAVVPVSVAEAHQRALGQDVADMASGDGGTLIIGEANPDV
jgi:prevent-host-death family protein